MGDPSFDDQVRVDLPDDLLRRHDVLWQLDDGPAEPGEVIGVLKATAPLEPGARQPSELRILRHPLDHRGVFVVPGPAHSCLTSPSEGVSVSNGSSRPDPAGACGGRATLAAHAC